VGSDTGTTSEGNAYDRLARRCARLTGGTRFEFVVAGVILANAVLLGVETYEEVTDRYQGTFDWLNHAFLAFFAGELVLRLVAMGRRPHHFFRSGWNCFDFTIVAAAFIPGVSANTTLLRLLRAFRIVRLLNVVPSLRIIIRGVARSLLPMAGVALLTLVIMYLYAIIGWILFKDELPAEWGTAGRALLTMFQLLTLEGWNETFADARAVSALATPMFVSFILIGTFVVLNIVIAVVVNSVEETRQLELEQDVARALESTPAVEMPELLQRLDLLRAALDAFDHQVAQGRPPDLEKRPPDTGS
jgi:voltage-gated sodium channel